MNILEQTVVALSQAANDIEDKLRERGKIVSLTGDSEAETHLAFEYEEGGDICLRLKISSASSDLDEECAEEIAGYINEKIYDALDELESEISEKIQDYFSGAEVYVNGKLVY